MRHLSVSLVVFLILQFYQSCSWCLKQTIRQGQTTDVKALDYSPKSSDFVAIARVQGVYIYNQTTFQLLGGLIYAGDEVDSVDFSKAGNLFAIGYRNRAYVRVFSTTSFPFVQKSYSPYTLTHKAFGLDFRDDGNTLLACGDSITATIMNGVGGSSITTSLAGPTGSGSPSQDCQYNSNGNIGIAFNNRVIVITSAGVQLSNFVKQCDAIDFQPGGNTITGCNDNRVYELLSGALNNQIFQDTDNIKTVAYAPDGNLFFVGGRTRDAYLFHSNKTMMSKFLNLNQQILTARFDENSQNLLVGTKKGYVYLFKKDCQFRCETTQFYQNKTCFVCIHYLDYCNQCTNRTTCISCFSGFVLGGDGKCKTCTQPGCLSCSADNSTCYMCDMGYFLNNVTNKCQKCSLNLSYCVLCNSSNYCLACDQMAYFDSATNSCKLCMTSLTLKNCYQCQNSTRCLSCQIGYFLNTSFLCSRCPSFCISCINNATVQQCNECIKGYFVNVSVSTNNSCVRCTTFGCINCNYNDTCLECQQGKYLASNNTCIQCPLPCSTCNTTSICYSCMRGYFLNSSNSCLICDYGCQTCNQTGQCLTCFQGFYLNGSSKCSKCSLGWSNCSVCTQSGCLLCLQSYYLNSANTSCISCQQNIKNCLTCNDSLNCYQCKLGYYKTGSTGNSSCQVCNKGCSKCINSSVCQSCLDGYYYLGGNCTQCVSPCITCLDSTTCLSCRYGFYVDSNRTCIKCHGAIAFCLDCYNSSYCVGCQLGYSLNTARSACSKCPANCTTCSDDISGIKCFTCENGYYLNSSLNCVKCAMACSICSNLTVCSQCLSGYYLDSSNTTCSKCPIKHCIQCYNESQCISCSVGSFLQLNVSSVNYKKCISCDSLINQCLNCNQDKQCTLCAYGYGLATNKLSCKLCTSTIEGCAHCQNQLNCLACSKSYYLNDANSDGNFQCIKCSTGCQVCVNETSCLYCLDGYYPGSLGECKTCQQSIQGCMQCDKVNSTNLQCLYCQKQYYLSTSTYKCLLCSQDLFGCSYCANSSYCLQCQNGFFLNTTTDKCQLCSAKINGCQICVYNSTLQCKECQNLYFLDKILNTCILCQSNLRNCLSCYNLTHCGICQKNSYLLTTTINSTITKICQYCDVSIQGCLSCLSDTVCLQCQSGYFLNSTTNKCQKCAIKGCQLCQQLNSTKCITCNSLYIFQPLNSSCLLCYNILDGCLSCQNSTLVPKCISCMIGFYKNTSQLCQLCSTTMNGCARCQSPNNCIECKTLYLLTVNASGNNSYCQLCSTSIQHCIICKNISSVIKCLQCESSYFLSADNLSCNFCSSFINNCIYCGRNNDCVMCQSQYFLTNTGTCTKCSTVLTGCYSCLDQSTCISCVNGYVYSSATLACSAISVRAQQPMVDGLRLVTFYMNKYTLKHVLYSAGSKFQSYGSQSLSISTTVKLTLQEKQLNSYTLNIISYQFSNNGYAMIFITDNPIDFQGIINSNLQMFKMKIRRVLTLSTLSQLNMNTNLQIPKNVSSSLLPGLDYGSDIKLNYGMNQPEFYASLIQKAETFNSCLYYIFGYIILPLLFVNFAIKALYTVPLSKNLGDVIPHVISLKMIAISIYPSYYEMISFSKGFMLFDLPWINKIIGKILSQQDDYVPKGYYIYYNNLNIGSTYSLALGAILCLILYRIYVENNDKQTSQSPQDRSSVYLTPGSIQLSPGSIHSKQSNNSEQERQKHKKILESKLSSYTTFWFNIFGFSLIQLSFCCFLGALFTPFRQISLKYIFYLGGSTIYFVLLMKIAYLGYYNFAQNINLIRVLIKSTILSLCYISPIYISIFVFLLDISLIYVQYRLNVDQKIKQTNKTQIYMFYISQFLANITLLLSFLINTHLLSLIIPLLLISLIVFIEVSLHYKQYKYFKNIKHQWTSGDSQIIIADQQEFNYDAEKRFRSKKRRQNNLQLRNQDTEQMQKQQQVKKNGNQDYVPTIQQMFMKSTQGQHFFEEL